MNMKESEPDNRRIEELESPVAVYDLVSDNRKMERLGVSSLAYQFRSHGS